MARALLVSPLGTRAKQAALSTSRGCGAPEEVHRTLGLTDADRLSREKAERLKKHTSPLSMGLTLLPGTCSCSADLR